MAKARKVTLSKRDVAPYNKTSKRRPNREGSGKSKTKTKQEGPQSHATLRVPFQSSDRILLLGEGDFSFSQSLLAVHHCKCLDATSHDTHDDLISKYPQAATNIEQLKEAGCTVIHGVDATKLGKVGASGNGGKKIRKGDYDWAVFQFPHVGGLTKDVNRQVRHNQELLVKFFKAAMPLLAVQGSIMVTIFEGEPYDLWNVRDLARHVGLQVQRSYKFQAHAFPGYKHVRTLGNINGGGAWKAEDRVARSYILELKKGQQVSRVREPCNEEESGDEC